MLQEIIKLIIYFYTKKIQYDIINFMKIFKKIKSVVDQIIENFALNFIFILGVGITTLVAKIFLKNFLQKKHFFTSWKRYSSSNQLRKMY